jgi:hypothetical protein
LTAKKLVIFDPASFFTGLFFIGVGTERFVGLRIGVLTGDAILTALSSTILTFDGVASSVIVVSSAISSSFRFPGERLSELRSPSLPAAFGSSSSFRLRGELGFEKKFAMFDLFSALFNGTINRGESSPTFPTSFLTG